MMSMFKYSIYYLIYKEGNVSVLEEERELCCCNVVLHIVRLQCLIDNAKTSTALFTVYCDALWSSNMFDPNNNLLL